MDERVDPQTELNDYPTAEDPFGTQPAEGEFEEQEAAVKKMQQDDRLAPSYEVGQDPADHSTGGSTDTHNFMTHANSGDETPDLEDRS